MLHYGLIHQTQFTAIEYFGGIVSVFLFSPKMFLDQLSDDKHYSEEVQGVFDPTTVPIFPLSSTDPICQRPVS